MNTTNTTKYTARFGAKTLRASIHAVTCPVAANSSGKNYVCFEVEATSAAAAAADVYQGQDFEARGLKFPTVCKCAR
jgi:hypothetical protein